MSLKQIVIDQMQQRKDPIVIEIPGRTVIFPRHEVRLVDIQSDDKVQFYLYSFQFGGLTTLTLEKTLLPEPQPESTQETVPESQPKASAGYSKLDYVI